MTPTTYGRDFAYCLKSHGGVRGFNASLWRFLLRCTLFCHSVATFLTSVSSYEGGCGFEAYETLLSDKNNMSKGLLETYPNSPIMFKDTYFIDFLNLPKRHSEKRLKNGLLEHMKQFILELGKDFIFMDQEYCLNVGASSFKADLLFFHRGLQALVAVELKKTKFHPRDLGQLEFYLEALDRDVKRSNENPSIGIILCPDADKVVVEYAMSRSMSPTMVAEYKRILIPQEKMQQQLKEFCQFFLKEDKS